MDKQGSTTERLTRLLKYLEHTPNNLNLILEAITEAFENQSTSILGELIRGAILSHPDSPDINAYAGLFYLQNQNFPAAKFHLSKAMESGITADAVIYNHAYANYQLREFESALNSLAKIRGMNPLEKEVVLLRSRCLHNTDQLSLAISELKEFLNRNENDKEIEGQLALVLYDSDSYEDAMYYANRSISHTDPSYEGLLARASTAFVLKNYNNAYADFKKAAELNPGSGRALSGLAQVDFYNFQFDSALEHLQSAVQEMPDHIGTWNLLGWVWLMKDNPSAALIAFENAYKIEKSFGETHGGLASAFALLGQTDKAEKHIKIAKRLDPSNFSHVYAQMVLLNKANKPEEAISLFELTKQSYSEKLGTAPSLLISARIKELSEKKATN